MENIVCFILPSFLRLFSKANRSLDCYRSLQSQPKKLLKKKAEYIQVSTMFERDLPDTTCHNWATKPYFWGSKDLTDWNPSRPKQFFLKYTSPVRNISTYLLLKREVAFFLVSVFSDKVECIFFLIDWTRCFKLLPRHFTHVLQTRSLPHTLTRFFLPVTKMIDIAFKFENGTVPLKFLSCTKWVTTQKIESFEPWTGKHWPNRTLWTRHMHTHRQEGK